MKTTKKNELVFNIVVGTMCFIMFLIIISLLGLIGISASL